MVSHKPGSWRSARRCPGHNTARRIRFLLVWVRVDGYVELILAISKLHHNARMKLGGMRLSQDRLDFARKTGIGNSLPHASIEQPLLEPEPL